MGKELRVARSVHSAAFWCITFISPRGTLVRDATMRSDTSSLFVVAVQENLPPTLDPMNMGFHPLSRRILRCRVHPSSRFFPSAPSLETSFSSMSGGIEAIKIGRINCWNAWISSREERIETLVGISINTVDRNALIDSLEKSFSFLIFV